MTATTSTTPHPPRRPRTRPPIPPLPPRPVRYRRGSGVGLPRGTFALSRRYSALLMLLCALGLPETG